MSEAAAGNAERFPLPSGGAPQCSQGTESPKGGDTETADVKTAGLGNSLICGCKSTTDMCDQTWKV